MGVSMAITSHLKYISICPNSKLTFHTSPFHLKSIGITPSKTFSFLNRSIALLKFYILTQRPYSFCNAAPLCIWFLSGCILNSRRAAGRQNVSHLWFHHLLDFLNEFQNEQIRSGDCLWSVPGLREIPPTQDTQTHKCCKSSDIIFRLPHCLNNENHSGKHTPGPRQWRAGRSDSSPPPCGPVCSSCLPGCRPEPRWPWSRWPPQCRSQSAVDKTKQI